MPHCVGQHSSETVLNNMNLVFFSRVIGLDSDEESEKSKPYGSLKSSVDKDIFSFIEEQIVKEADILKYLF